MRQWMPIALLVALVSSPQAADAQRRRGGDAPDRAQLEQRMRAQMARMMQARLGLDEAEAAALSEIVGTFDAQRRALFGREQATRRRVDALVESGTDVQDAPELLRLQADLRMEEAQLLRAEQEALLGVLTARQVLELQELREALGRRIRALRGGGRNGGQDSRGPGPRSDRQGGRGLLGYSPPA
ncbi:MAG: hypothetical protein OEO79_03145 [Gemmatimonadota bacterium]|nr:hypothetical protein [Gemmatimonadota bacterium]